METAIPIYVDLKRKGKFPNVAPLKLPCPPNVETLVTMSELVNYLYKQTEIDQLRLIKESQDERDSIEERVEGDRWSEMHQVNTPEIDNKLVSK